MTDSAGQSSGLPTISAARILRDSGPRILRDSVGPVAMFYLGFRLPDLLHLPVDRLLLGIALGAPTGIGLYVLEVRSGRSGVLARLSLGFVILQSAVGLISRSVTLYFLQPVLLDVLLASIFIGSAVISRPLIGAAAKDTFPFPPQVAESATFRRVFGRLSLLYGFYFFLRAGVRLLGVRTGHVEMMVIVNAVTDAPFVIGLIIFSAWYAVHGFRASEEWGPLIKMVEAEQALEASPRPDQS